MLTIHYSNRLETLADALAAVTREPLESPFTGEVVLVQSRGVARWLSLRLAEQTGVCANVRFPFPNAYAWELYRGIVGSAPETSQFEPQILTWRIAGLLEDMEDSSQFAPVKNYVKGDALRRYELALRLAEAFDQYQVYRPDWIALWERGKAPHWQAALWKRLSKEAGTPHRAALQAQLIKVLREPLGVSSGMPERVSIFGAAALPPALLDLFAALAQHSDVHLFVPNPCREYWGDIAGAADIAKKRLEGKADAPLLDTGNSLLASLGKQGRDFIDLLTEVGEARELEHYAAPRGASLLASIQSDILDLRERGAGDAAAPLAADDSSVQVHSCHSAMREVEVLHDQLLALFSAHPGLEPSDVVVMTPDIETYAPYIEAVFDTAQPHIPFNVSDRSAERESTLAATLMALLGLPGSRYEVSRVLAILDEPSVQRRFGLTESDLERVQHWVREAQIRWGIDAGHRASFGLPATHEHTWRFGLDRLLLGYALPAGGERLFADVLPYDEIEGSLGEVLGRFQSFAESAIALDRHLAAPRSIAQWCDALHDLLTRFFDPPQERAEELEAVRSAVAALEAEARTARFTGAVPLAVVVTALRERLEIPGRAFLSGGVTFCAMVPMRSLPFEIVCMIGMNDGAFPRMRRRDGFDLMANEFRKGDRSRRDDDRYLFLESLLSARRCVYMSYTGRHIREDTVKPPSVLVSELLDYIARGYRSHDGKAVRERLVTPHPLQAFSRRYFEADSRLFSYSDELRRAAALAGRGTRVEQPFITEELPPADIESRRVDLEQLTSFFRNPARYLFRNRLNVRLETAEEELEAREPFALEGLTLYDLKRRLLDLRLREQPYEGFELARAGGVLPHGPMGEVLFADQDDLVERFARHVAPHAAGELIEPVSFEMATEHLTLSAALTRVRRTGLVDYRLANVTANDRLKAWIRHLVLNAIAPPGVDRVSRCIAQDGILVFAPVEDARERLGELLALYWTGWHRPLHFFPKTACAYAVSGDVRASAVRNAWNGPYNREDIGEREDPYFALAFRGIDPLDAEFEAAAMTVFGAMNAVLREDPLA